MSLTGCVNPSSYDHVLYIQLIIINFIWGFQIPKIGMTEFVMLINFEVWLVADVIKIIVFNG